ncbi:BBSome complex assembly protein BBS10 [Discoglossus pictus]
MDLNISKVLEVAESLQNIVCRCFGRDGGQVLFMKSTGDLLITKDGKRILDSLLLDHPVARVIVNSASHHYSITGDGVKSFIVLLCGMLRGLKAAADKSEGQLLSGNCQGKNRYQRQGPILKRMSHLLMTFQTKVLDQIIWEPLSQHFLSVFSNSREETVLCRASMQAILDSYFCGKISFVNYKCISNLALEYLYKCLPGNNNPLAVISLVSNCLSELHTEVPGHPIENSKILPGLVLHRPFSVYCPAEGELRALVVTEPIHQSLSESDIGFVICSETQLLLSQQYLTQRTENIIKHFQNNQVKLILSSVKQPEIVLCYAKQSGISIVDCLPVEEIDLVCRLTGISPLSKPMSDTILENIFLASCCKPILLGLRKYVHLVLNYTPDFQSHCVVMCGPVKGLSEQIVSSFKGAFIMLNQLFQPMNMIVEQRTENVDDCKPSGSESVQINCVCDMVKDKDSACCKCKLQRISPFKNMNIVDKEEDVLRRHVYLSQNIEILQKLPALSATKCTHNSQCNVSVNTASYQNAGLVMPGAGTFEMVLHYYLCHFAKKCREPELALICSLVGDALLSIPKQIYKAKKGNLSFPFVYAQLVSDLQSGMALETKEVGLESVSCKYQLVASVFHCISMLVTIDSILAIKRLPHKTKSESDDEDCD